MTVYNMMNTTLRALVEPNRRHIIDLLRDRPHSVNEIAELLRLSQPLVSNHLRVLSHAQLVRIRPNAQQLIYELEATGFKELNAWLDSIAEVWKDRLETFDNYLQSMKEKSNHHDMNSYFFPRT
jgi:DNA-binding transcriptional ArsR family regulator